MTKNASGADSGGFVGLKSPKGREFMGKDSGESGMQLEESRKTSVANPECGPQPVPKLRKTGQHQG